MYLSAHAMHLDEQILFVHNPRTSGTSIRRALLRGTDPNHELQFPAALPDMGKHAFPYQIKKKMQTSRFIPADTWDNVFKFSIVRNPWDRMVSLYGLFRRFGQADFKARSAHAKVPIKLRKFINQLEHPTIHSQMDKGLMTDIVLDALKLDFKDWLKFCDEYSWQGCPYLGLRPMTRIPQSKWFDGLDMVLRFEDRDYIDTLLTERGYPPCTRDNTTKRRDWRGYYDSESYDLVADAFRVDAKRFGYGC